MVCIPVRPSFPQHRLLERPLNAGECEPRGGWLTPQRRAVQLTRTYCVLRTDSSTCNTRHRYQEGADESRTRTRAGRRHNWDQSACCGKQSPLVIVPLNASSTRAWSFCCAILARTSISRCLNGARTRFRPWTPRCPVHSSPAPNIH